MNDVYMTGVVIEKIVLRGQTNQQQQTLLTVRRSYRDVQKRIHEEVYAVRTWGTLAEWADAHLQRGTPILVKGFLKQQQTSQGYRVEIAATHFMLRSKPEDGTITANQGIREIETCSERKEPHGCHCADDH